MNSFAKFFCRIHNTNISIDSGTTGIIGVELTLGCLAASFQGRRGQVYMYIYIYVLLIFTDIHNRWTIFGPSPWGWLATVAKFLGTLPSSPTVPMGLGLGRLSYHAALKHVSVSSSRGVHGGCMGGCMGGCKGVAWAGARGQGPTQKSQHQKNTKETDTKNDTTGLLTPKGLADLEKYRKCNRQLQ